MMQRDWDSLDGVYRDLDPARPGYGVEHCGEAWSNPARVPVARRCAGGEDIATEVDQ